MKCIKCGKRKNTYKIFNGINYDNICMDCILGEKYDLLRCAKKKNTYKDK